MVYKPNKSDEIDKDNVEGKISKIITKNWKFTVIRKSGNGFDVCLNRIICTRNRQNEPFYRTVRSRWYLNQGSESELLAKRMSSSSQYLIYLLRWRTHDYQLYYIFNGLHFIPFRKDFRKLLEIQTQFRVHLSTWNEPSIE